MSLAAGRCVPALFGRRTADPAVAPGRSATVSPGPPRADVARGVCVCGWNGSENKPQLRFTRTPSYGFGSAIGAEGG